MDNPNIIRTYGGDKFELDGQSVQEYLEWRKAYINLIGHVLVAKFPGFYGKIEFNLKGGILANANMVDCIKGMPVNRSELKKLVKHFDKLVEHELALDKNQKAGRSSFSG